MKITLAWCFIVPVAGLVLQQAPAAPAAAPPLPQAAQDATSHILSNIQKLHQEATMSVAQQSALINALTVRKEKEARDAIEKEIPLASANDTQELANDVAEQDKELDAALSRSTQEAQEALRVLKDKTADSVNASTQLAVRNVEKEAEEGAVGISKSSIKTQAEAAALAKEAMGAANFSQEAAKNSALWVSELPLKDAAEAVQVADKAEKESVKLRHEYDDVKRIAKLAGNLALNTMRIAKQADAQAEKAKMEATLTAEQAAQNALLLNTIRQQTKAATQRAQGVVAEMK